MHPQPGIFITDSPHQHHLEFDLLPGVDAASAVAVLAAAIFADGHREGDVPAVVGFGPNLARAVDALPVPSEFAGFEPIVGSGGFRAPGTQGDLWLWLQGSARDRIHDRARDLAGWLEPVARLVHDVSAFQRQGNRDLTGFVDGTANPKAELRFEAALIPGGRNGAGGSIALTQRWRHDLKRFHALDLREQEAVIGRTKADDIELEGDDMLPDSHVSRTDLKVDGVAQKIYRRSAPYGDAADHGLMFVAFACEQSRIQIQLEHMFGLAADGLHDRVVEFSTARTGSFWFVPSAGDLHATLADHAMPPKGGC